MYAKETVHGICYVGMQGQKWKSIKQKNNGVHQGEELFHIDFHVNSLLLC
jgi:phosphotransferase system IIA component